MSRGRPTIAQALRDSLRRGGRYLLAVSGGIDSMTLLHACVGAQRKLGIHMEVAHVDHGVRCESTEDAAFVEAETRRVGLPFHLKNIKPPARGNIEAWGRRARYEFFSEICKARSLDYVLTAHTANDVAETFLMRLLSNKELRPIERINCDRKRLRPLLAVPRAEIERYARTHGLAYRSDSTNADEHFLRNRVRHKLIPLLEEQFDKRAVEVLALRAGRVAEDLKVLDEICRRAVEHAVDSPLWTKAWRRKIVAEMAKLPEPLHWRIAETLLLSELGFRIGALHGGRVAELLKGGCVKVELPGARTLRSYRGAIVLSRTLDGRRSSVR